jgi:hypothetical protein
VDRLHDHLAVVGDELEGIGEARAECRIRQGALAEAVDREDGGLVEVLQRLVEDQGELFVRCPGPRLDAVHEARHERID